MSTRHLVETTVTLLLSYIKANIPVALSHVRSENGLPFRQKDVVTTEPPRSYFIYDPIKGFQLPAVVIVPEDFDFRPTKGANHINASAKFHIACLIEEHDMERLNIKAYRYLDAFHEVLAQAEIADTASNVKLVVIATRASFTPEYSNAGENPQGVFRKELHLECDVEHYSNF